MILLNDTYRVFSRVRCLGRVLNERDPYSPHSAELFDDRTSERVVRRKTCSSGWSFRPYHYRSPFHTPVKVLGRYKQPKRRVQ